MDVWLYIKHGHSNIKQNEHIHSQYEDCTCVRSGSFHFRSANHGLNDNNQQRHGEQSDQPTRRLLNFLSSLCKAHPTTLLFDTIQAEMSLGQRG